MSNENLDEFVSDFSRFYILTFLYEGPCHGYSILKKFKKLVGKEISPSLVYPFLQQLEQKKLLKSVLKLAGEKERKIYELTEKGERLCVQLFKRFASLVSVAIEPGLKICAHCGCKVYEGGYLEEMEGDKFTFCCVYCARSYKKEREENHKSLTFQIKKEK